MTPSPEQLGALQEFAKIYGHYWKHCLRYTWLQGYRHQEKHLAPYLQQIRNQFGPEWLSKFKLDS